MRERAGGTAYHEWERVALEGAIELLAAGMLEGVEARVQHLLGLRDRDVDDEEVSRQRQLLVLLLDAVSEREPLLYELHIGLRRCHELVDRRRLPELACVCVDG